MSSGDSGLIKKPDDLVETMKDLRKTDYFDKVQMKLKKLGNRLSLSELVERMKSFDEDNQGRIKIHHFINVLKHNY
jgi:Ca2+-binding EF-hand superfamily protein